MAMPWSELFAKVLLIFILAAGAAKWQSDSAAADQQRAQEYTLEAHIAEYETEKAALMGDGLSYPVWVFSFTAVFGLALALYEVLGRGLGQLLERLSRRGQDEAAPPLLG